MASSEEGNPWEVAEEMGIDLRSAHEVPWTVATTRDTAIIAWHPDPLVVVARAWDGVARCLLTRAGVPWSEDEALLLAARLRVGSIVLH